MVQKKSLNQKSQKTASNKKVEDDQSGFFKFNESYASLLLGLVVVVIAASILVTLVRNRSNPEVKREPKKEISATRTINLESNGIREINSDSVPGGSYNVQEDDDLWKVSEKIYGNGQWWLVIAQVNNINNPSVITVGQILRLPTLDELSPGSNEKKLDEDKIDRGENDVKDSTTDNQEIIDSDKSEGSISETYTVKSGDNLWKIAEMVYGDGYKWTQIALVNNLSNPDIIHKGNIFKIPR
jgi:nucleoid-associated protein YgaU